MTKPRSGHFSIIFLPRTDAGRSLLRSVLHAAFDPSRSDGELPDGRNIYGCDFDALAEEGERDYANYERWCREQGRGGEQ